MQPPSAPRKPYHYKIHGVTIEDPYSWLANIDDPDTAAYLRRENEYTDAISQSLRPLQEKIYQELRARIAEDDCSVPQNIGEYLYYSCSKGGQEYEVHYRRRPKSQLGTVVLDENELAKDSDYFDLGCFAVCPRHRMVAYTVDRVGDEFYQLYVRDIDSGEIVEGPIENVSEDVCWSEDATSVFYVRIDDNSRPFTATLHVLGTAPSRDRVLFKEEDPAFFVSLWKARSKAYVFIETHSNTTSEIHFIDVNAADETPRCFRKREPGVEYAVDHRPGEFLIVTNLDAPNFRLLSVAELEPRESGWQELIANRCETVLEYIDVYATHTVLGERRNGVPLITTLPAGSKHTRELAITGDIHELEVEDLDNFASDEVWLSHSSPTAPDTLYAYPFSVGERRVLKANKLEGYDPGAYSSERLWVTVSSDKRVPITLIKKHTTKQPAPVLLSGYGAYEECCELYFDSDILSLLDRGVIIAIAHVRGGGELGRSWYTGGKLMEKENGFSDFLACAEFLIAKGYTTAGKIALQGSSAGGLLVAVTMQRRPELFAGVVAEVPFVDVINTLLDDDAPLTQHDIEEFGDPRDPDVFKYLVQYSPYENVRPGDYPPLLVTAAMEDQRVGYWEPLKWVAKLRAAKTDHNLLLLKLEEAGHYGQSGRYQQLRDIALIYAFLLRCWGIDAEDDLK
jgi:oligopeptidase B